MKEFLRTLVNQTFSEITDWSVSSLLQKAGVKNKENRLMLSLGIQTIMQNWIVPVLPISENFKNNLSEILVSNVQKNMLILLYYNIRKI